VEKLDAHFVIFDTTTLVFAGIIIVALVLGGLFFFKSKKGKQTK